MNDKSFIGIGNTLDVFEYSWGFGHLCIGFGWPHFMAGAAEGSVVAVAALIRLVPSKALAILAIAALNVSLSPCRTELCCPAFFCDLVVS